MTIPAAIRTPRLTLVPATPGLAQAELNDVAEFSALLGAAVPDDWPPGELSDARLLFLCMLEANPAWIGWLGWYALESEDSGASPHGPAASPLTLVGSAGFKGPPDREGTVEIGYSVLPGHEGRGLATEMTAALVEWAARQGARIVHAEVRPDNPASARVLQKLGFREAGTGDVPGMVRFEREADADAHGRTQLEALHREVDEGAVALEAIHRDRLRCSLGCCFCCVDEITVFEIEAERIRRHHAELLAVAEPNPIGSCAFLDDRGGCRIYEHRPYVCRTQGLPLRWEDETPDGEPAELRDICPLNESGRPIEMLPAEECWEIGPFEERLRALQAARPGGQLARIRLRDLFARRAPEPGTPPPSSGS